MGAPIQKTLALMLGGSSLTSGRLCNPPLPWTRYLLEDMLASPSCKGPVRIINTGKGSQTSNFGASQAALFAPMRPTHVLMEDFGINDCAIGPVSIPQATANFNSMVASYRAENPDVVIVHQTMSPASAGDAFRTNLPAYYDNGLANAALNDLESLNNYYGTPLVPGGWVKPLPPSLTVGYDPLSPPAGFTIFSIATTWDSATKSTDITLTNSDLTATRTASSTGVWVAALATNSNSSGKWFWQVTAGTVGSGLSVGICQAGFNVNSPYIGQTSTSWGYLNGGTVANNGSGVSSIGSFTTGDLISVALDLSNSKIWFKKNSGNWNNSGAADPATNTGGISIAAGTYFAAVSIADLNSSFTANFGNPGDGLHPIWPNVFQIYSYPNILAWANRAMADFWGT